jgi:ATP-dependent DNA helicase RecG
MPVSRPRLLAPTEVLATAALGKPSRSSSRTSPIPSPSSRDAYQKLGGDTVKKATLVSAIRAGIPKVVIGTHAVLQEDVRFGDLALIIVDEQHRFGVEQRAYLQSRAGTMSDGLPGLTPHFLTMTATPIPRTLALAFFGDLDLSLLDELPKSRKPIKTKIARNQRRPRSRLRFHPEGSREGSAGRSSSPRSSKNPKRWRT